MGDPSVYRFLINKEGFNFRQGEINRFGYIEGFFQKRVLKDHDFCETNSKLFVNITHYRTDRISNYTMEMIFERHGIWWQVGSYSLHASELAENYEFIFNTLKDIALFIDSKQNQLKNG